MQRLEDTRISLRSKTKQAIITAAIVTALVTIDLLATRQVIPVDSFSEPVIFILTVVVGYGIGSWVLFVYTSQITKEIRQKSPLIKWMHTIDVVRSVFPCISFNFSNLYRRYERSDIFNLHNKFVSCNLYFDDNEC